MPTKEPQNPVADVDRAELLWHCYCKLVATLAEDGLESKRENYAKAAEKRVNNWTPKVKAAVEAGTLSACDAETALGWLRMIGDAGECRKSGNRHWPSADERIAVCTAAHAVVEDATRPVMGFMDKWSVPKPCFKGEWQMLKMGQTGGLEVAWSEAKEEHEQALEKARNKLLAARVAVARPDTEGAKTLRQIWQDRAGGKRTWHGITYKTLQRDRYEPGRRDSFPKPRKGWGKGSGRGNLYDPDEIEEYVKNRPDHRCV